MEAKIDRQRVQDFARKLFGHYTSGILTLLVDVGHKTGLFEAAALCINTIRTFYLIVLAILGPLVFGIAVFDGFQHTRPQHPAP